jgi:hypothetical protein
MGNKHSKTRRDRLPKINVQPASVSDSCLPNSVVQTGSTQPVEQPKIRVRRLDEITSVSDSCLPNPVAQMGSTQPPVKPQRQLPEIDARRDEITSISSSCLPNSVSQMGTTNPHRLPPKINFRVLIIGRANAGKTSILQKVCNATDSPVVWRGDEEVRSLFIIIAGVVSLLHKVQLEPSMDVGDTSNASLWLFLILELAWRAQHPG